MKYYEDLINAGQGQSLIEFVLTAINEYKGSELYQNALTAYEYFRKRNVTITKYQKLLYKLSGEVVPDNFSSNYKFCNAFFPIFVRQENSFLLGNGVTFNSDKTKDKLGGDDFDKQMYVAGEYAIWGAVSFVHAGIRFWQVAVNKPLRATLYEEDGYAEFIWEDGQGTILQPKRAYKQIVRQSVATGTEILDGQNYPAFPIVPLWANREHQSEFTGLRAKIDGYDLIQSGLCNTIDEASLLYWVFQNAGAMDDVDLAQNLERIKTVKAVVASDEMTAEPHTIDVPYQATQIALQELRDSLYRDAMALDTDKISAGNITATAINAAYENLELKCDGYEYCVTECVKGLLNLIGVKDSPTYHRRKTTNQPEVTDMILAAANYLDDETILKHLPFINIDEVQDILKCKDKEESDRFKNVESFVEKSSNVENDVESVEKQLK